MGTKGVIVAVREKKTSIEKFNEELNELKLLSEACNLEIVETVTQDMDEINNRTYVGSGKVLEIKEILSALDVSLVIINDELTPLQISVLDETIEATIYDRTYLILEIFKKRAKTKEAIIQVEMASISYMLPRLAGLRKGLSRQRGSSGSFAHGKGAGESKLELDRRISKERIVSLKNELKELKNIRKQQRVKRNKSDIKTVCLVGYTNSGKSTLMNCFLSKSKSYKEKKTVFQKDMLFATLETKTRRIDLSYGSFILTDTVGFIEKLPHSLIEAFKSTLEEIKEADLIIHVVDASNEKYLDQINASKKVLEEIGVTDKEIIYAFNKIDKVEGYFYIPNEFVKSVRISAKNNIFINDLETLMIKSLYKDYTNAIFYIPYSDSKVYYDIINNAIILNKVVNDSYYEINALVNDVMVKKYYDYQMKKE